MASGFSSKVDCLPSNQNYNDGINGNSRLVDFANPAKCQIDSLFTRVQHRQFVCGAYGEKIAEESLMGHHLAHHSEVPFIMDMYELFEIDERFQCSCCNYDIVESNFQTHLELFHPELMADNAEQNGPLSVESVYSTSEYWNSEAEQQSTFDYSNKVTDRHITYNDGSKRFYQCKACPSSSINGSNLRRHHSRVHPDIPAGVNLFYLIKTTTKTPCEKVKCDVCSKQIKSDRIDKHRLKYHPDKYGKDTQCEPATTEPPQGFHNICISTSELERLKHLDRIYQLNGRIHLKDSNDSK